MTDPEVPSLEAMAPLPEDHPLIVAWTAYKETSGYKNTLAWAHVPEHVEGSLWASFMAGWEAANGQVHVEVVERCPYGCSGGYILHSREAFGEDGKGRIEKWTCCPIHYKG